MLEGEERPTSRLFEWMGRKFADFFGITTGTVPVSLVARNMIKVALDFKPNSQSFRIYENSDIRKL